MTIQLRYTTLTILLAVNAYALAQERSAPVRIVVWDEQQPKQKQAYDNFLGNAIADYLKARPGFRVRSVSIKDPDQGLAESILDECDVLIWWGHVRQHEIRWEKAKDIVRRVKAGRLALIALHSAHWSRPFIEAMNERTRTNVARRFHERPGDSLTFRYVMPAGYDAPERKDPITPLIRPRKYPDGRVEVVVDLPICCFPAYRPDGKPSSVHVLTPDHPIVKGVPRHFPIGATEMYDEPFHVPDPDEVILEERWPTGEWFRSGSVWNIGKGKVFYFRPGHETYPVFKQALPLRIVENAARWLARSE